MSTTTSPRAGNDPARLSAADHWFAALDQRQIGTGPRTWVVQVLGVHGGDDDLWVQIAPSVDPGATIVLHLSSETPVEEALRALEHRAPNVDRKPDIIDLSAASGH
jgi:hypothetical protein